MKNPAVASRLGLLPFGADDLPARIVRVVAIGAVVFAASIVPADGATFTVNSKADAGDISPGDGTCGALVRVPVSVLVCTLRAAIEEVNALLGAHTINLPGGLYLLTKGELDVRANVTINGPRPQRGLSLAARIDGNNQSRVFDVANGFSVHINRVTIRHGRACRGAGIRNDGALTITSSVIRDNALDGIECDGGGIRNTAAGTLTIHSSTIRGNTGSNHAFGGGVSNDGSAAIFDSTIRDNHVTGVAFGANGGGGIKSTGELPAPPSTAVALRAWLSPPSSCGVPAKPVVAGDPLSS